MAWLKNEIAEAHHGKTVIVTHHAPSIRSVDSQYKTKSLSAAYASSLENFVAESGAALWVHGHLHDLIGQTRIVCKPRGYTPYELNKGFRANLAVMI